MVSQVLSKPGPAHPKLAGKMLPVGPFESKKEKGLLTLSWQGKADVERCSDFEILRAVYLRRPLPSIF